MKHLYVWRPIAGKGSPSCTKITAVKLVEPMFRTVVDCELVTRMGPETGRRSRKRFTAVIFVRRRVLPKRWAPSFRRFAPQGHRRVRMFHVKHLFLFPVRRSMLARSCRIGKMFPYWQPACGERAERIGSFRRTTRSQARMRKKGSGGSGRACQEGKFLPETTVRRDARLRADGRVSDAAAPSG